jgi:ankyrin repeat/BTB/POZ domain-containing protein 1
MIESPNTMLYSKDQLEVRLLAEKREIAEGRLRDYNPLDTSWNFQELCEARRRGDVKVCQELVTQGVNINAVDRFDNSPLGLVRQNLSPYSPSGATPRKES